MGKIPGVDHLDAIRALETAGFRIVRQGKHTVMSNGGRILTVPRHNPVNAFTLGGIVRDAVSRRRSFAISSEPPANESVKLTRARSAPRGSLDCTCALAA